MAFTAEAFITHTVPHPEHTKDMPFKGVCPAGRFYEDL
jgi:hypothetical protein